MLSELRLKLVALHCSLLDFPKSPKSVFSCNFVSNTGLGQHLALFYRRRMKLFLYLCVFWSDTQLVRMLTFSLGHPGLATVLLH